MHHICRQHFVNFVYPEVNDRIAPEIKLEPERYDMHPFVSLSIPFDFQDLYQPIQSNNDEITAVELNQKDDSPITKEGMRGHLIRIICGIIFFITSTTYLNYIYNYYHIFLITRKYQLMFLKKMLSSSASEVVIERKQDTTKVIIN